MSQHGRWYLREDYTRHRAADAAWRLHPTCSEQAAAFEAFETPLLALHAAPPPTCGRTPSPPSFAGWRGSPAPSWRAPWSTVWQVGARVAALALAPHGEMVLVVVGRTRAVGDHRGALAGDEITFDQGDQLAIGLQCPVGEARAGHLHSRAVPGGSCASLIRSRSVRRVRRRTAPSGGHGWWKPLPERRLAYAPRPAMRRGAAMPTVPRPERPGTSER